MWFDRRRRDSLFVDVVGRLTAVPVRPWIDVGVVPPSGRLRFDRCMPRSSSGAASISKNQSLGFSIGDESGLSYEDMKTKVMGELKKVFRPELLNRIDEIIVFHKLTKDEIKIIIDLLMRRLREQMGTHEVAIELTDEAKDLLVEKGYDPAMGARPLRRAIQRYIEDPLADFVLGRSLEPGSTILVGRKGELVDGEPAVDLVVLPPDVRPEAVTVPADGAEESAEES